MFLLVTDVNQLSRERGIAQSADQGSSEGAIAKGPLGTLKGHSHANPTTRNSCPLPSELVEVNGMQPDGRSSLAAQTFPLPSVEEIRTGVPCRCRFDMTLTRGPSTVSVGYPFLDGLKLATSRLILRHTQCIERLVEATFACNTFARTKPLGELAGSFME